SMLSAPTHSLIMCTVIGRRVPPCSPPRHVSFLAGSYTLPDRNASAPEVQQQRSCGKLEYRQRRTASARRSPGTWLTRCFSSRLLAHVQICECPISLGRAREKADNDGTSRAGRRERTHGTDARRARHRLRFRSHRVQDEFLHHGL